MVVSLLLAGVIWNLATWWYGLPVSSSHTLIGSILGVGLTNSLITRGNLSGVNWSKATEVAVSLLISPLIGFVAGAGLLRLMKRFLREPRLYHPPDEDDNPPRWVRGVLLTTCGGVSLAHGSNDGQKGMGLILLALIGFLPSYYCLDLEQAGLAQDVRQAAISIRDIVDKEPAPGSNLALRSELDTIAERLDGKRSFVDLPPEARWLTRKAIFRFNIKIEQAGLPPAARAQIAPYAKRFSHAIEYVPMWVVIGVALALGTGTMVGYQRIVVTVAKKIGKSHLTYGQGAAAEMVAALTIGLADVCRMPVSTTHVLSSAVAGTMWINKSGLRADTIRKIGLAWVMTLPAAILISAGLFYMGGELIPNAAPTVESAADAGSK
jgi:phosphate/sulfate permease